MSDNCIICGIEAKLKCGGCKNVAYCGVEHQKKDWKIHKLTCSSKLYEVGTSDEFGRFVYAAKDIPKGTVILTDAPIVVGPKWDTDEAEKTSLVVPCVGCFEMTTIGRAKCPECNWPACKNGCPGLTYPQLHAIECPALSLGRGPMSNNTLAMVDYYRFDALLALKCLMLQKRHPKKWEEFIKLEAHFEERKGTPFYEDAERRVIAYLKHNYIDVIKAIEDKTGQQLLPDCDFVTLQKICGRIETNAITVELKGQEISGLYPIGSIFEHSCLPNCFYTFDISKGFKIYFKAGRNIKKGEHLSISYTSTLWGTLLRRDHLKNNKYFSCKCKRCSDPTEFETYFSALKCFGIDNEACFGYQLPINPLDEKSDWACNVCPVKISSDQVSFLVNKIGEDVDAILIGKASIKDLEDMIEKLSTFVHKNHFQLFNLKHALISRMGHEGDVKLTDFQLKEKLRICTDLLAITDCIDPFGIRLVIYTSIILYEMATVIMEQSARKLDKAGSHDQESQSHNKALQCLIRAKELIKMEIHTAQGQQLNEKICEEMESVEKIMTAK